jgi:hypothetical protein
MNRAAVAAITTLIALLTGCAEPLIPKPNMDAKPTAFPYPGIYTGTATGGTLTYRIDASGRGLSCIRTVSGRMMYGDVIYDGAILHTEDGDLEVVSASSTGLQLKNATHVRPTTQSRRTPDRSRRFSVRADFRSPGRCEGAGQLSETAQTACN